MATDLQYREGLTDTQKNQLVTRLDRINAGSAITDTDKANFNYGLGSSWQSYLSPSINYNDLGKTPSPTVGTQIQPNTTADSVMAGLNAGQQAQQAQLTAQQQQIQNDLQVYKDIQMLQGENKAETAYGQATQGLMDLRTKEQEKSQALAEAYKSGGVQEYQKKLDELNQQAAQLSGSYLQGLTNVEGKVMPMRFITGQQAQMQKQYATQASAVALQQQALQGNIENAKSIAKEMVDLEYGDIEAQIANQKEIIDLNYANLTREDKKRADEQKYLLDQQQARIDEEKATQQSKYDLAITAFENGAPQSVASKIMNSKDIGSAIMSAGAYLSDMASKVSSGAPVKIGTDSKGKDIFYMEGYGVVTGDQLLGNLGGGTDEMLFESYDPDAYNWAVSIRDGKAKLSDISGDPDLKTRTNTILNSLPPSDKAIAEAEKMIATLKTLFNPDTGETHPGLNNAVGPAFTGLVSRSWVSEPITGSRSGFLGIANQIVSKKALDELISSKKEGATFGALSDREMDILKSASTVLGTWEKQSDGKVTGYKTTESNFKKAISDMINEYQSLVDEAKTKVNDPLNLTKVGGDTNTAILNKLNTVKSGEKGGQCGRFVNKLTGYKLGLGDSYQSKISKMDPSIRYPEPGMVFVTPYKDTGHTGFIVAVNNDGTVTVKDSNYGLDEKVRVRTMPITKITGLARV